MEQVTTLEILHYSSKIPYFAYNLPIFPIKMLGSNEANKSDIPLSCLYLPPLRVVNVPSVLPVHLRHRRLLSHHLRGQQLKHRCVQHVFVHVS